MFFVVRSAEQFHLLQTSVELIYGEEIWRLINYYIHRFDLYVDVIKGLSETADNGRADAGYILGDEAVLRRLAGDEVTVTQDALDALSSTQLNTQQVRAYVNSVRHAAGFRLYKLVAEQMKRWYMYKYE